VSAQPFKLPLHLHTATRSYLLFLDAKLVEAANIPTELKEQLAYINQSDCSGDKTPLGLTLDLEKQWIDLEWQDAPKETSQKEKAKSGAPDINNLLMCVSRPLHKGPAFLLQHRDNNKVQALFIDNTNYLLLADDRVGNEYYFLKNVRAERIGEKLDIRFMEIFIFLPNSMTRTAMQLERCINPANGERAWKLTKDSLGLSSLMPAPEVIKALANGAAKAIAPHLPSSGNDPFPRLWPQLDLTDLQL